MTIEERIERLERTNRRYRRMFTLLGVLAVCAVGISAAQDDDVPEVIQAKRFEVVDDEGTKFVEIGLCNLSLGGGGLISMNTKSVHGLVKIRSFDAPGANLGSIAIASPKRSHLLLLGPGTLTLLGNVANRDVKDIGSVVELSASDGAGLLQVFNNGGHGKSIMLNGKDGSVRVLDNMGHGVGMYSYGPSLEVFGGKQNDVGLRTGLVSLSTLSIGDETVGLVQTYSDTNKSTTLLTATDTGGAIGITNKAGEQVCQMTVDEDGNGVVIAANRNGKGRTLKPGPDED